MSKQQHYPPTCPICGASLPHTTPMAREYHENVVRRSNAEGQHMSLEQQLAWCRLHRATVIFDDLYVSVSVKTFRTIITDSLEVAIENIEAQKIEQREFSAEIARIRKERGEI